MVTREWFDKEYTAKEAYGRLWRYARRYRHLLIVGILAGMVVGGAWLPIFKTVQPALLYMSGSAATAEPHPKAQTQSTGETIQTAMEKTESALGKVGLALPGWIKDSFAIFLMSILGAAFAIKLVAEYFNHYCLRKAGVRVVRDLRNDLFDHLQDQSLGFYGQGDVGRLISRCTTDPGVVENVVSVTISEICQAPFEIAAALSFVIVYAIQADMMSLLVTALILYPVCLFPLIKLGRRIRKWSHANLQRSAGVVSVIHENLTCIRVVKAYHTEDQEKRKFATYIQSVLKSVMRTVRIELLIGPVTQAIAVMLLIAFMFYSLYRGKNLFDIAPLLPPFLMLYKPFKQLGKIQASIEKGRAALIRIFSLLDVDTALPDPPDPIPHPTFEGTIRFDRVSFRYQAAGDPVITDANLEIRRGQMFAVVGSTGSGKSTLANLLARFYDPTQGTVSIDGIDLRHLSIANVRRLIGVVTQETILFNLTIAENIAYGTPGATPEQIIHAATLANAHTFITAHPEGYGRNVGEKGFVLSGGERQRIAIARAILKNPPILILDEATSALDTVTEQQVQEALTQLMRNRTVFAIAHRLSTIRKADQILVMDKGAIVERGTHDQLYRAHGIYRHLCDIQHSQDNPEATPHA